MASKEAPPSNKELLKTGTEHYRAQQYDQAIASLSKVTNEDPAVFSQALAILGRCYTRLKVYEQALEVLALSMKIQAAPLTQYYIGECYYLQGDFVTAESELELAVIGDDKLTDAWILLGTIRRNKGQLDVAIQAFNMALRNDPKAIAARFHLAQTAYDTGDLRRATSQAYMILQQAEDFAPVHMLLGHCALRLNDFRQAAYEYCRVLQLGTDPTLEIYEGLGRAFSNLRDFEQGLKAFEAVIMMAPDHEMAHVAAARLAERLGDNEKALKFWQEASRFPKYTQLAADALAKLGVLASVKAPGKKKAKAAASAPAELPRDFTPPPQIDRSAIPKPAQSSMPTAPLTTHAAGTLSLASRKPAPTQPISAPTPADLEEESRRKVSSAFDQLIRPYAEALAGLFGKKPKPPEPEPVETIADMIAKRNQAAPKIAKAEEVKPAPKPAAKAAPKPATKPKSKS